MGAAAKAALSKAYRPGCFCAPVLHSPRGLGYPCLVLYLLVTDNFSHAFGPILNLLSAVTSTASGSRICEFLAHGVQSVLSALTQFAASFCRNPAPTVLGFGKLHMVRAAYSTCLLPLWVLSTCIVIPPISCTLSLLLMEISALLMNSCSSGHCSYLSLCRDQSHCVLLRFVVCFWQLRNCSVIPECGGLSWLDARHPQSLCTTALHTCTAEREDKEGFMS